MPSRSSGDIMKPGDKIKMCGERQRYTVQGFDDRFIIATKPFNARRTYLYTIIDRLRLVRGPINMTLGLPNDVNTPQGAEELLTFMREEGGGHETWGVSQRRDKPLTDSEIEQIKAVA